MLSTFAYVGVKHGYAVESFTVRNTFRQTILTTRLEASWTYDGKKVVDAPQPLYFWYKSRWILLEFIDTKTCVRPAAGRLWVTFVGQGVAKVGIPTPWGAVGFNVYHFYSLIDGWYNGKYVRLSNTSAGPCH